MKNIGEKIAIFIAGLAAGLAAYRWILSFACGNMHYTMCDICRYRQEKAAGRREKG